MALAPSQNQADRDAGKSASRLFVLAAHRAHQVVAGDLAAVGGRQKGRGDRGVADETADHRVQGGQLVQIDVRRKRCSRSGSSKSTANSSRRVKAASMFCLKLVARIANPSKRSSRCSRYA